MTSVTWIVTSVYAQAPCASHVAFSDKAYCTIHMNDLLISEIQVLISSTMSVAQANKELRQLLHQNDNRFCADCNAPDPKWASVNMGVFICLKCCGIHKSLGPNVSKVLSVTIDAWSDEEINSMIEVGGNFSANAIYEAFLPTNFSKPGPDASQHERWNFIRSKYEFQEFLKPSLRITSKKSYSSFKETFSSKILNSFRRTKSSPQLEVEEEVMGLVKVKVKKGMNLAIRDVMSSDPYVMLYLGHQMVQTSVIYSNLNPIWNEEYTLSVPSNCGLVKLKVYDHDTFSTDDIMGEADIDIQPLITSAMGYENPEVFEDMQIGKWLKSWDNDLLEDSTIKIVDGKIKQEVSLKLQNVECGEIYLDLEWMSINQ